MVASGLWAAQDALKVALRARSALDRVAITLGEPARYEDDHIWISGEVSDWSQKFFDSAATGKDESFTLTIYVYAKRATHDYAVTRDRVKVLCDEVEEALASDLFLGGSAEFQQITDLQVDELIPDERHRALLVTLRTSVNTWLA